MTLLFVTQKISQNDDDLGFVILWIKEFIRQGIDVKVICLEKGDFDSSFDVFSLGKEKGSCFWVRVFRFLKFVFTLKYDRVFIHMNPEYITLAGWFWFLKGTPVYLWYTHYKMHIHMFFAGVFCKRMFAATAQSMPQYNGSAKKIVTGHGIDFDFWIKNKEILTNNNNPKKLLSVHRLCRSKRVELGILALKYLPEDYSLTIYGRDVEKDYVKELHELINKESLENRVIFKGPTEPENLKDVYSSHRLMINMASETIDKTMLESMLFGIYPITTKANSFAIGLPVSIKKDVPKEIADFIISEKWKDYDVSYLDKIVKDNHSLSALIEKMNKYISLGE